MLNGGVHDRPGIQTDPLPSIRCADILEQQHCRWLADYDADGLADVAVFRGGLWYIQQSSGGIRNIAFGLSTDIPAPASYLP